MATFPRRYPRIIKDMIGKKFGCYTVEARAPKSANPNIHTAMWFCRCECGAQKIIRGSHLRSGAKLSGADLRSNGQIRCRACAGKRISQKLRRPDASLKQIFGHYKRAAKNRKFSFALTFEDCRKLFSQPCYYCGTSPCCKTKRFHDSATFAYNGLDRVDNARGYEKDNVVSCCKVCNMAKRALSVNDFISMCHRVVFLHPKLSGKDE